ncbi:hypothetical protein ISE20_04320 [Pseudomonas aeruginosa]|nr:hypothetical protein [Pseudomonas aeruginosa]
MSKELNKALDLLREIRPSIPKDVLELWCKDRDAFLASHKAPVEQAGGDERAVDGKPRATKCPGCGEGDLMPGDLCACGYETDPAAGYACSECDGSGDGYVGELCRECDGSGWFVTPEQARAALAQPSPKCATCGDTGQIVVSGPHYCGQFQPPEYETEPCDMCAQPSPAQAEVERPEVVARVMHSNPVALDQCAPLNANDELMTVAQHAASVARWAEMFNRVEQERDSALAEVERLTRDRDDCLKARLHYATQLGEALARVAELENQDPVAHLRASDLERLNQPGIAGSAGSLWNGPREGFVPLYAAPVAQAQHSVPDELRAICMLVAETGIKYGGGRHRAVAADECRAVVNAVLNADLSVGRACEYAGCCEKAHPGTSLCIAHHSKKAREQLLAAAPQQGGRS